MGSPGTRRFFFPSTPASPAGNSGRDVIFDFRRAEGDLIDLRSIDADAENASPDDAFESLGKGPTFHPPGQVEYVFEGSDTVVRVNTAAPGRPRSRSG